MNSILPNLDEKLPNCYVIMAPMFINILLFLSHISS